MNRSMLRITAGLAIASALAFAPWQALAGQDAWLSSWAGPTRDPGATGVAYAPNTTERHTVWATLGGNSVRVKFTNAYGAPPRVIGTASIGIKSGTASVFPDSLHALTFGGNRGITVP